jgi:ssDNA-binding Zn-finger/Zn-ribbon topoisomerase 1
VGTRGPTPIADSPRPCEACGVLIYRTRMPGGKLMSRSVFLKRRFCGKKCAGKEFSKLYRQDDAEHSASHRKARLLKPAGPCERCGKPGRDVHHKDRNWRNNEPSNLERLCRSCHTAHHKREGMCGV